jgi:phosphorylcholine metabolism protein LicD
VIENRVIPLEKVDIFESVQNFSQNHNVTTFLISGSLLGWLRECTIIPHTHDIDFAIKSEDITEGLIEKLFKQFKMTRKLGESKNRVIKKQKIHLAIVSINKKLFDTCLLRSFSTIFYENNR